MNKESRLYRNLIIPDEMTRLDGVLIEATMIVMASGLISAGLWCLVLYAFEK